MMIRDACFTPSQVGGLICHVKIKNRGFGNPSLVHCSIPQYLELIADDQQLKSQYEEMDSWDNRTYHNNKKYCEPECLKNLFRNSLEHFCISRTFKSTGT